MFLGKPISVNSEHVTLRHPIPCAGQHRLERLLVCPLRDGGIVGQGWGGDGGDLFLENVMAKA
jgi:hypothetical protein